jgi:hypothetical protein
MRMKLTLSQMKMIYCDDGNPEKLDFARRCFYLGYGLHVIHDWMQGYGTLEWQIKRRDIEEVSDLMGITALDTVQLLTLKDGEIE